MDAPFCRSPYNYDADAVSLATSVSCSEGVTHQEFKDECDINTIVQLFGLTGHIPQSVRAPVYADYTGVDDYRTAIHAVREAEESFAAMPANVRERFRNDAAAFVDWCSDDRNYDEAVKLGLIFKPAAAPAADPPGA